MEASFDERQIRIANKTEDFRFIIHCYLVRSRSSVAPHLRSVDQPSSFFALLKLHLLPLLVSALFVSADFLHAGNNRKLIETLLENEYLTEEQAADLLANEPTVVRPAGDHFKNFRIRGRIQAQAAYVYSRDDDDSEDYSTVELRRVYLGVQGTLFQNVRAQIDAILLPGSNLDLRSAFLQWREYEEAFVKVGYDRPVFGFEHTTSSTTILTVERSTVTQTIVPDDTVGVAVDGKLSSFGYGIGIYTNRDNGNISGEGRYLYSLSGSWRADDLLPENQKLQFRTDLLFNDDNVGIGTSDSPNFLYKRGVSVSGHYVLNDFDFRAEYLYADSFDSDATHGWYVMPSYFITEKLQVVGRYEQLHSDANEGLRSPNRYARRAIDQNGDRFKAIYAGTNYYFKGDANKVMFGVELSELETSTAGDQESVTIYGAWRVLF